MNTQNIFLISNLSDMLFELGVDVSMCQFMPACRVSFMTRQIDTRVIP